MGTRNIPNGLRGVMLFENFLVSRHDTIFTECPGRILSWSTFRRYWVHRWAADRLRSQIGLDTFKSLLRSFDETVEQCSETKAVVPSFGDEKSDEKRGTELEEDETTPEIKVRCSDFYRTLEEDSILLNHQKRDLILRAVSLGVDGASDVKATKFEDSISWGMYMHALIFHIHDSHEREKRAWFLRRNLRYGYSGNIIDKEIYGKISIIMILFKLVYLVGSAFLLIIIPSRKNYIKALFLLFKALGRLIGLLNYKPKKYI